MAKELLPRDRITHSLQGDWFPSDWRRLRNSSCALVVHQSAVTGCVCSLCGDELYRMYMHVCFLLDLLACLSLFVSIQPLFVAAAKLPRDC